MSNMDDFKAGKISVWAETKADAERFLAELARKGFKKASGLHIDIGELAARQYSYVCNFYDDGGISRAGSDRYWYSRQNIPGKPYKSITVAEFFGKPKCNEQIVAYYNSDETVTCIHKKDGKVVQSAVVKRYYKDADDLRVATEHALGKMLVEQKQAKPETLEYQPGDRVLVRDDLVAGERYGCVTCLPGIMHSDIKGKVLELIIKNCDGGWYTSAEWSISPEMLVGKIVSLDGLKAGDEVLVKSRCEGDLDEFQSLYANKVITIEKVSCSRGVWVQNVCFDPSQRFVGKLIRVPSKG